jgi:HEAT repeat protein
MSLRRVGAALYLLCLTVASMVGQDESTVVFTGGPVALTEQLRLHGIELTREGLLKGLRNPDSQVRYLAALRLAEERDSEAAPAIEAALAAEKVPATRINIAIALVELGQPRGSQDLIAACGSPKLPDYLRTRAMLYMLPLGSKECFAAAINLLAEDPDSRNQVLSALPRYREPSREESEEELRVVVKCLADKSAAVRAQASISLANLASPSAVMPLQEAIAAEQDDVVRSEMQKSLELLRNNIGSQSGK